MRLIPLIVGLALFAVGVIVTLATWVPVANCLAPSTPGCGSGSTQCASVEVCPIPQILFGIGLGIAGGVLLGIGALTKSRDQITAEVLANPPV